MIKRFLCVLLTILMLTSAVSLSAYADATDGISVYVTLSDKGVLVMANLKISVTDLDGDGIFTVDEVLYAAHETSYEGGALTGYGTQMGDYGLYITCLWGDESGNYGYWRNDSACMGLSEAVSENDYVVAYVYQNTEVWDSYSKFSQADYTALSGVAADLTLEIAGYDASWNTVFSPHKGAMLKLYDAELVPLDPDAYQVLDNGDGSYSVTLHTVGVYTVAAYDDATPIVPAVCTLTVSDNEDAVSADAVKTLIDAIGTVTSQSRTAIESARAAYDMLTDAQKALVTNYKTLLLAEETFALINVDAEKANAVDALIDAIGSVTIHSFDSIGTARAEYDALTESQKALVKGLASLNDAENTLAKLYEAASKTDIPFVYEKTLKYADGHKSLYYGNEWLTVGLLRSGLPCRDGYYNSVTEYVKASINANEQLHRAKSTENSRLILALTSAGYDVTDVDGHNLLVGLTDMTYLKKQGINGPIWALIAFDSHNYQIPQNNNANEQVTREKLIAYILEKQQSGGGFALSGDIAEPEMTASAILALSKYYDTDPDVKAAVDKALDCLSEIQYGNGCFSSMDGSSAEAAAQVVMALVSVGIDPEKDERFIKNGISALDALCLFALENGGFMHIPDGDLDGMATEQALLALTAYSRMLDGDCALFDMTDVELSSEKHTPQTGDDSTHSAYVLMVCISLLAMCAIGKKRIFSR